MITQENVDIPSIKSTGIHLREISQLMLKLPITEITNSIDIDKVQFNTLYTQPVISRWH